MNVEASSLSFELPAADEMRVDVFGPGVGECTVVHLGDGSWAVIDSCKGRGRSQPAATEYLTALGADFAKIEFIIATHWHDDHIRGIAELYERAPNAKFCVAAAVRPDEFLALTGGGPMASRFTSGVAELGRVEALARARGTVVTTVSAGQRLRYKPASAVTSLWTLSPSATDVDLGRRHLRTELDGFRPAARRLSPLTPNDTSVVVLLESDAGPLLLGGDLEHISSQRDRGWHAVLDLEGVPSAPASVLKAPHHGSINAHCPEVWEHKVMPDALTVVTPFERGTTPLPRPEDRDRMRAATANGFLTSDKRSRPAVRDRVTSRTIRETVRSFRPQTLEMGHVQLRWQGSEWLVGLSEEATAI